MSTISPDEPQTTAQDALLGRAQHVNWSSIPVELIAEGMERQMVVGENLMICLNTLDAARRAGVDRIEDVDRCTYGSPREFFSYRGSTHRGEPDYGRHVNAIALTGDS